MKNYETLHNGVIKQKQIVNKIIDYDVNYVDERYNSYGEKGMQLAYLRLGYLMGAVKEPINSILDVGYGNGDFLKSCKSIKNRYGNDVSNYQLPDGCEFINNILTVKTDVTCFFDSLEHFEEIDFVKNLRTKYIYISLPFCHNFSEEWFMNWKHRREDEHLYHFNPDSLTNFMNECGFELVCLSNVEDVIRIGVDENQNILTGIFKKI